MTDSEIRDLRESIHIHGERLARVETTLDGIHRDIVCFRSDVAGVREEVARQSVTIAGMQVKWALIGSLGLAALGLVVKLAVG